MSKEKDTIDAMGAIKAFTEVLENRNETSVEASEPVKGSCVFTAAGVTSCLNFTKSECDLFNGFWSSGSKCSPNPKPGECKAGPR